MYFTNTKSKKHFYRSKTKFIPLTGPTTSAKFWKSFMRYTLFDFPRNKFFPSCIVS